MQKTANMASHLETFSVLECCQTSTIIVSILGTLAVKAVHNSVHKKSTIIVYKQN